MQSWGKIIENSEECCRTLQHFFIWAGRVLVNPLRALFTDNIHHFELSSTKYRMVDGAESRTVRVSIPDSLVLSQFALILLPFELIMDDCLIRLFANLKTIAQNVFEKYKNVVWEKQLTIQININFYLYLSINSYRKKCVCWGQFAKKGFISEDHAGCRHFPTPT